MMRAEQFLEQRMLPGLLRLEAEHGIKTSDNALALLLAIAMQESGQNLDNRAQVLAGGKVGPAMGFWMFEKNGGVAEVLTHPVTARVMRAVCTRESVPCDKEWVWRAMMGHDVLAVTMARLLLWKDPATMPTRNEPERGWQYYQRNWRPGKPHPSTWLGNWTRAWDAVNGADGEVCATGC